LFVSISQVIGCEDRLRNDLYCVEWGVKLYSNETKGGGGGGSMMLRWYGVMAASLSKHVSDTV